MYDTLTSKSYRSTLSTCMARRAFQELSVYSAALSCPVLTSFALCCHYFCYYVICGVDYLMCSAVELKFLSYEWSCFKPLCTAVRKPMELIQSSHYLLLSVASVEGHATRLTRRYLCSNTVFVPMLASKGQIVINCSILAGWAVNVILHGFTTS